MLAPKLVNIKIAETSGVDHPAHLHEGWLVMKATDAGEIDAVINSLVPQEETVNDDNVPVDETEVEKSAVVEAEVTDLQSRIAELEAALNEKDEEIVRLTEVVPAVDAAIDEPVDEDEILKSAPEAVRKALEAERTRAQEAFKKAAIAEAALAAVVEERETTEWIAKAAEWNNLAADPADLGPALRQVAKIDEALVNLLVDVLKAANAQAEAGAIFTEIGSSPAQVHVVGDAWGQIQALAKAKVAGGAVPTIEQGIANVISENPDLYTRYMSERSN
jgi:phosphopantetheine adenylyltransferase